jgi:hypothetical protein
VQLITEVGMRKMGRVHGRAAMGEWAGRRLVVNECVWVVWDCAA